MQEKKAELDSLGPLAGPCLTALDAWYDVELTYTSNALEGNTLTRSETAIVLQKGITVSGKPLKDHLEASGHMDALRYVRELVSQAEPVLESDIRNIHRLLPQRIDPEEAGRYSNHQRLISGSTLIMPSPAEVPSRMESSRCGCARRSRRQQRPSTHTRVSSPSTRSAMATGARPVC